MILRMPTTNIVEGENYALFSPHFRTEADGSQGNLKDEVEHGIRWLLLYHKFQTVVHILDKTETDMDKWTH